MSDSFAMIDITAMNAFVYTSFTTFLTISLGMDH